MKTGLNEGLRFQRFTMRGFDTSSIACWVTQLICWRRGRPSRQASRP